MIDVDEVLSEFDRIGTEPCLCGTPDGEVSCPNCNLTERVRRNIKAIAAERDGLRSQRLQTKTRCATCRGYGTVRKPWGTFATCEACDGRG